MASASVHGHPQTGGALLIYIAVDIEDHAEVKGLMNDSKFIYGEPTKDMNTDLALVGVINSGCLPEVLREHGTKNPFEVKEALRN